jgi:DNA-binding transcriptional LysR family regulator
MRLVIVAAPSLVAKVGRPKTPEELRGLPCIVDTNLQGQANWRFVEDGKTISVHVSGPVRVNSPLASLQAATMGLGFAAMPSYLADPAIDSGELISVLADFVPDGQTLQAVYPHRRHLAGKVRALIDHLIAWFEAHPVR